MDVFVGQTRSRKLIARLAALGFGEMVQPYEWPPRRRPSFLDNAAFSAWRAGRGFDAAGFESACFLAAELPEPERPVGVVCPDRVATGLTSLAFSLLWLDEHGSRYPGLRWYLAVQDGMIPAHLAPHASRFAGLFVGGTLAWKIATGAMWVRAAHDLGMPCHIGRVGTPRRVRWARRIGADSIDSSLPLWAERNLEAFCGALESRQNEMPW